MEVKTDRYMGISNNGKTLITRGSHILTFLMTILIIFSPLAGGAEVLKIEDAVKKGLLNHESIKAARYLEKKSEYDLKKAKVDRLFKISASYTAQRFDDNQLMIINGSESVVGGEKSYSWNLNLVQPVFTGFALQSSQKIAEANLVSAKLNTRGHSINIAWRIKKGYNNLYLAEKQLMVAEQTLKSLKAHKTDARKFYKNGLVPYNDLLKAEVKMAEAIQNRENSIANYISAKSWLNLLIGRNSMDEIQIEPLTRPAPVLFDLDTLKRKALLKRPEIQSISKSIEIIDLAKTIERSTYYPHVSIIAGHKQNGGDYFESASRYGNSSIGIQIKWTLFDFRETNSRVESKIQQRRAVSENLKELKENISYEVETSLRNLKVARKNIETAEKGVDQAKENFRITNIQYRKQTTTSTEVLNARTFLSAAETSYYRALHQYWSALADLQKSIGVVL